VDRLNRKKLEKGQGIRILDGPFGDFEGVIDEMDLVERKVKVVVVFFGRRTPVVLDYLQVARL
jgi:transcriptional antiterminator NusG